MQPEGQFIKRIHRCLPPKVHHQSMRGMYHNGTPDQYYEGPNGILWVEYKWRKAIPRKPFEPALTALQRRWLNRANNNGVHVAVIVGCRTGGMIFDCGLWNRPHLPLIFPKESIADWITGVVYHV